MSEWFASSLTVSLGAFALAGFLAGPANAEPQQINVNCNGQGSAALQNAIDSAVEGQTIRVLSTCVGNYEIITDDLVLEAGPNGAVVGAEPDKPALLIRAHRVVVDGFSSISGGSNGVGLYLGASATIRGNVIEEAIRNGVVVNQNSHADIVDNTIQNNGVNGIAVVESASAEVHGNVVTGNGLFGVLASRTGSAVLNGNTIESNAAGVGVLYTSSASLAAVAGEIVVPNTIQNNTAYDVGCSGFSSIFAPTVVYSNTKHSSINFSTCDATITYADPPTP